MRFPAVVSLLWAEVLESSNYVFGDELLIDAAVMPRLYAMWLEVTAKPNMKLPRLTHQPSKKKMHSSIPEAKSIAPVFLRYIDIFYSSSSNT